jgi:predicted transcriptional regulator
MMKPKQIKFNLKRETLKHYRDIELGVSQMDIAERAGVSPMMVSLAENGHVPLAKHWKSLARAYEISDREWKKIWK